MWDCCFIHLFSYGKHDEQYPNLETERMQSQTIYEELLNQLWYRIGTDLSGIAPREWPRLWSLSEDSKLLEDDKLELLEDEELRLLVVLTHCDSQELG